MARAVEWPGRAESGLRLTVEYIRNDSPDSAKAFLSQVFQATRSLSTFSERGRFVTDLGDPAHSGRSRPFRREVLAAVLGDGDGVFVADA